MAFKGMVQINKKDLWTIPNLITYFRMLCVPAFVILMAFAGVNNNKTLLYIALGVFAIASISDLFDGWIARKFNMVSGIGMVFDPLADKLMHVSVLACLAFCTGLTPLGKANPFFNIDGGWYVHYGFVIAILIREILQISLAPISMKNHARVEANMLGKVGSFTVSIAVILGFFHPYLYFADWGILGWGIAINYAAALGYLKDVITQARLVKKAMADGTYVEGETGRDIQIKMAAEKLKKEEEERAAEQEQNNSTNK